ncbi:MAG: hypothetical protein AAB554_03700 [Patescibacteria group bacterium]
MGFRPILLTPRFESTLARLWQNTLPGEIRLETDPDGPGFLDAEMLYKRAPTPGMSVHMARWTLVHDERNGRVLRLTFPESRLEPRLPYDELSDALRTINLAHASAANGSEPYRFGLAMSSKLILEWLMADEAILRAALTPPFRDAST